MLGRQEPGLVTPAVYSGLEMLSEGYSGGELGIVDGESILDVVFEVQLAADFIFDFSREIWGDPDIGPAFSLENVDTGESIFWGLGWSSIVGGEYVDGSEDGGSLAGTLDPGNYALSATIWSHWSPSAREAPGGSLDLELSFGPGMSVPEPSTALLVACGLVGLAIRRRRAA